jgi:hypothetical protein
MLYVYLQIAFYENVLVGKQEAINSLQEELDSTQDHLDLAKQVRLKI